jgi:hypothetical protein
MEYSPFKIARGELGREFTRFGDRFGDAPGREYDESNAPSARNETRVRIPPRREATLSSISCSGLASLMK